MKLFSTTLDTPGGVAAAFNMDEIAMVLIGRDVPKVEEVDGEAQITGQIDFEAVVVFTSGTGRTTLHGQEALEFTKVYGERLTEAQRQEWVKRGWPASALPMEGPVEEGESAPPLLSVAELAVSENDPAMMLVYYVKRGCQDLSHLRKVADLVPDPVARDDDSDCPTTSDT